MTFVATSDHFLEKIAQSKRVPLITFLLAFCEQSFSPVLPEAYVALVLSYRKNLSWKFLSFVSACGSACGSLVTYLLGYYVYSSYGYRAVEALGWTHFFQKAQELFNDNVFIAQFVASLTPLPDRVFSFTAGAFGVSLLLVVSATFLGRLVRMLIVAYCAYEWGDEARDFIKKHTKMATGILVLIVVMYVIHSFVAK